MSDSVPCPDCQTGRVHLHRDTQMEVPIVSSFYNPETGVGMRHELRTVPMLVCNACEFAVVAVGVK